MTWTCRSYNFCNNGVTYQAPSDVKNGDKDDGCLYNQTVAQEVGSEVLISKRKSFADYETYVDSGPSYPLEVSSFNSSSMCHSVNRLPVTMCRFLPNVDVKIWVSVSHQVTFTQGHCILQSGSSDTGTLCIMLCMLLPIVPSICIVP